MNWKALREGFDWAFGWFKQLRPKAHVKIALGLIGIGGMILSPSLTQLAVHLFAPEVAAKIPDVDPVYGFVLVMTGAALYLLVWWREAFLQRRAGERARGHDGRLVRELLAAVPDGDLDAALTQLNRDRSYVRGDELVATAHDFLGRADRQFADPRNAEKGTVLKGALADLLGFLNFRFSVIGNGPPPYRYGLEPALDIDRAQGAVPTVEQQQEYRAAAAALDIKVLAVRNAWRDLVALALAPNEAANGAR